MPSIGFDPYYKWLAIPPEEQPPHHYRLLGVKPFESDVEVISTAADQRMAHVRSFQTGPHAALSQAILNELSVARLCLLNAEKKASYDLALRTATTAAVSSSSMMLPLPVEGAGTPPPLPMAVSDVPLPWSDSLPTARAKSQPLHRSAGKGSKPASPWTRTMGMLVAGILGIASAVGGGMILSKYLGSHGESQTVTAKVAEAAPRSLSDQKNRPESLRNETSPPDSKRHVPTILSMGDDSTATSLQEIAAKVPTSGSESPEQDSQMLAKAPDDEVAPLQGKEPLSSKPATSTSKVERKEARLPVPADAAQSETMKLVKEVYGDEYGAATTAEEKQSLAKKLFQKANETQNDSTGKYVLLKLAKDIAIQAGDVETAYAAVDAMATLFQVSAVELKSGVLTGVARKATEPLEHGNVAKQALVLIDQAIAEDNLDVAIQVGELAKAEARLAKGPQLAQRVKDRLVRLEERAQAYSEMNKAASVLAQRANDPEANLAVGKYLCLIKGDWGKGLPMLAIGNDQGLKEAATNDLEGATSPEGQVKLGDGWWGLASTADGDIQKHLRDRAVYWYQKALPGLTGLVKDKLEKRLAAHPATIQTPDGSESKAAQAAAPQGEVVTPVFLADMQEMNVQVQRGWFDKTGKIWGRPIQVNGQTSPKGIFMHPSPRSFSRVQYKLDGRYEWFLATAAVDSNVGGDPVAPIFFEVLGDGDNLWKSPLLGKRGASAPCKVNVSKVHFLELKVQCTGWDNWAAAVWLEPRVVASPIASTATRHGKKASADEDGVADGTSAKDDTSRSGKDFSQYVALLRKKLHGRVAYDQKAKQFIITYDWANKMQLEDFTTKAKLAFTKGKLALQAGESVEHIVPFKEVTVTVPVLVSKMEGKMIRTSSGACASLGGVSDTIYLGIRDGHTPQMTVPKPQRTGLQPVQMTISQNRLGLAYGIGEPSQIGRTVENFSAGKVSLFGGDMGLQYGTIVLAGTITDRWLEEHLESKAAEAKEGASAKGKSERRPARNASSVE